VVAVTGAFGALGRRLLARLEEDPTIDRIVAIDVRSGLSLLEDEDDDDHAAVLLKHPKLSAHTVDLTTPGTDRELADLLRAEGAGSLFHLAMLSTPTHHQEMAHELETVGTHYVLNATASAGIRRLVMLSSTMCYGARPDNPAFLTEDHPLRPPPSRALKDKADADKDASRFAAEHPDIAVCVARLGAMIPTVRDHFWTRTLSRRVVPAVLGYDPLMQFMHPDDGVAGLLALWRAEARGPVNVVGRGYLPLSHILTRLERAPLYLPAGLGQSLVSALWQAQLIDMPPHFFGYLRWPWLADDRRLKSLTGFSARHDIATVLTILATERKHIPTRIDEASP
jgi:UDP-glucose 4-epimerase